MVEFLFFRHGETDWNVQKRFQGHTDIRLNEKGMQQAQLLSDKVRHWKPDVILSSDLTRAFHTAEYCQMEWRVPLIQSADLREMHLGEAEGLHRDEVMKLVGPDMWKKWLGHEEKDEAFQFPKGETKAQARNRVLRFLERFAKENPRYKRIAVSTHGGVLKRVTHGLPGVPPEGVPIPNCITYRLNFDGYKWIYLPVRERASGIVLSDNQILTFHAIDPNSMREYHFLPGGKIEEAEGILQCVTRETLEETGYHVSPLEPILTSEYDFHWNGQDVWCRTHFVRADLISDFKNPEKVQDADYNKGVKWIPAHDLGSYFHYNDSIFESVRKLTSKS